jgi:hypothetical protein
MAVVLSPYVSFPTFMDFIDRVASSEAALYKACAIALDQLPQTTRRQLSGALKGLDLVDLEMRPAPALTELITAHRTERFASALSTQLDAWYPALQSVNVNDLTAARLAEYPFVQPYRGATRDRAVRFILHAYEAAGRRAPRKQAAAPCGVTLPPDYGDTRAAVLTAMLQNWPPFDASWPRDVREWWSANMRGMLIDSLSRRRPSSVLGDAPGEPPLPRSRP